MSQENCDYIVSSKNIKPQEVVNIPISLARSMQGKYFAGQTEALWVNNELNAWAGLINPRKSNVSDKVSPSDTALEPLPINEVDIRYVTTTMVPENGVNVFERIVPSHATLVSEEDGKFIEPPGGSYVVVIKSASSKLSKVIVAFGWWEDDDKSL